MKIPFLLHSISIAERKRTLLYWILLIIPQPLIPYLMIKLSKLTYEWLPEEIGLPLCLILPVILASIAEWYARPKNIPLPLLYKITAMLWAGIFLMTYAILIRTDQEDGETYAMALVISFLQLAFILLMHPILKYCLRKCRS